MSVVRISIVGGGTEVRFAQYLDGANTKEVKEDLLESERPLKPSEWGSGEHVFINDFIATRKNSRHIIRDMMTNEVPDAATASSLRRNPDGSVNKINRWFRGKTRSRSS